MLYTSKIGDLNDDEVKYFIFTNFGKYIKSMEKTIF